MSVVDTSRTVASAAKGSERKRWRTLQKRIERARGLRRQGIEDNLEGGRVRHTAVTLTVHEFGLDSLVFSLSEKVHSARGLHANVPETSRNCLNAGRG